MFDNNFHKVSGAQILATYIKDSPQKAALALQSVSLSEAVFWLSSITLVDLTAVLEFMEVKKAAVILRRLPLKQGARALLSLNPQKAGEILNYVPPFYKKRLEGELTPEELSYLKNLPNDKLLEMLENLRKANKEKEKEEKEQENKII